MTAPITPDIADRSAAMLASMQPARAIAALLVVIGLAVYLPFGLRSEFVAFDDNTLITGNPVVQEFTYRSVARAWTSYDPELYVPLTIMSYQIEYAIAGHAPAVFHATNLLLHLLSVLLLFAILRRMTGSDAAAGTGAALFLLHPIQTEAVLWVSARKDLLSGAFALASLLSFLRWRDDEGQRWYWLCCAAFLAALLSKVTVALLPAVFVAIDIVHRRTMGRAALRTSAPFLVAAAVFIVIALLGKSSNIASLSPAFQALLATKSFVLMLAHIIWPVGLNVLYPQPSTAVAPLIPYAAGAAIIVLAGILVIRRHRHALIGASMIAAAFLPSVATFMKNGLLYVGSDRYAYLAMAGVAMLLTSLLAHRKTQVIAAAAVAIGVIAVPLTLRQAATWQSTQTLFARAVAVHPQNALAHNNLGAGYLEKENTEDARKEFELASTLDPHYPQPHLNLAMLHRRAGRTDDALRSEQAAVSAVADKDQLLPDDVNAHAILARSYAERGRVDDALSVLADAARRAPYSPQAFYNLGALLYEDRRLQDAVVVLRKAVELEPRSAEARYLLAGVLSETGDVPGARDQLIAVLRLAPGYEHAQEHLRTIEARLRGEGSPR